MSFARRAASVIAVVVSVAALASSLTREPDEDARSIARPSAPPVPPGPRDVEHEPESVPTPRDEALTVPCGTPGVVSFHRPTARAAITERLATLGLSLSDALADPHVAPALSSALSTLVPVPSEALEVLRLHPARRHGEVDLYVAALEVLAARALTGSDTTAALRLAHDAARAAPEHVLPHMILAEAYTHDGQWRRARESMVRAYELAPDEPAIALQHARDIEQGPDLTAALDAFDHYLARFPDDVTFTVRRARLARRAAELPSPRITTWSGVDVSVVSPSSLTLGDAERTLSITRNALTRVARALGIAPRSSLTVFVYPDIAALRRATCGNSWTGGMFDGAIHTDVERLGRFDHGARVITHEVAHATMRTLPTRLPAWLNEGIAQYLAHEEGLRHFASYELMVREHTWIPFDSLDGAFGEIEDASDAGLAYHQALAMVLWLVDRGGDEAIANAVSWLSSGGDPARLFHETTGEELDGEVLLEFVAARLAATPH